MTGQCLQFDPALKELVLRRTGRAWDEVAPEASDTTRVVPVMAKLADPDEAVPGLRQIARFGSIVTGRVPLDRIVAVRQHSNVVSLKAARRITGNDLSQSSQDEPDGIPESLSRAPARGSRRHSLTGRGTMVVVIDWYCDFAHDNFRNPDGSTRLAFIWDQRGSRSPTSPEPFGYGRVLSAQSINTALQAPDPYREIGYDPALGDPSGNGSHGTHVMDIAAGNGAFAGSTPGVAPEATLGFVHLRRSDYAIENTLGDSVRLLEAIRFSIDAAGDMPVVINLSMGDHGGPHDGSTLFEQALDTVLSDSSGIAFSLSTGNYFSSNVHTHRWIAQGQQIDIDWHIRRIGRSPAELEVWYPKGDRLNVSLISPAGTEVLTVAPGEEKHLMDGPRNRATIYHRVGDPSNGDNQINIFLRSGVPVGLWKLRVQGIHIERGNFHAWIEKTSPRFQSRFLPHGAIPTTTTNTICNGRLTIATGAHDIRAGRRRLARFSSSGPTRDGRRKPDLVAHGVGILAARSTHFNGRTRIAGSLVRKSGTSMAAPQVAGTIALIFQAALPRRLNIQETRSSLFSGLRHPDTADDIARMRFGRGVLDVERVISQLASTAQRPDQHRKSRPRSRQASRSMTVGTQQ